MASGFSKPNRALISLPRSGSTWLAESVKRDAEMGYSDEPLRTAFGQESGPLHSSRLLNSRDIESVRDELSPVERAKFDAVSTLRERTNWLVKETNGVFQVDFWRNILDTFEFVFLERHPGGIINSLNKVNDVWTEWSFDRRVKILIDNLKERANALEEKLSEGYDPLVLAVIETQYRYLKDLLGMFDRANNTDFFGGPENASILAYIGAHIVEARIKFDSVLQYEELVSNGIPQNIMGLELKTKKVSGGGGKYLRHSTKNPSAPDAWMSSFRDEDFDAAHHILGKHKALFRPIEKYNVEQSQVIPPLCHYEVANSNEMIANRPVSSGEFLQFLHAIFEHMPSREVFDKLGFEPSSTHNFRKVDENSYIAIHPDKPIVHISPLAALAFSYFQGYSLPTVQAYTALAERYRNFPISPENTTFGDISKLRRISSSPQVDGLVDIFGNVSEIALDESRKGYVKVGGSYKDEKCRLGLSSQFPLFYIERSTETGFRMGTKIGSKFADFGRSLIEILKSCESPFEVNEKLTGLL